MDRFTWGIVAGVVAISLAALVSAIWVGRGESPPDPSTPEGVATAYILAIQNKEPDKAWDMLASPEAAGGPKMGPRGERLTRESFRQQVYNAPPRGQQNKRLRMLGSQVTGDVARVNLEITRFFSGPFGLGGSSSSETRTFELRRHEATWRITAAPVLWELA